MERRLYEAAVGGSIPSLHELLEEDPEVLDKFIKINCFDETILHVVILQGHLDFVKEILERRPELARELDSQQSSPLHLASANGQVEIVKALLGVDVLNELVQTSPNAARAPLDHGKGTIMHLCVQHNQLEALKLLVEKLNDEEFVNSKDVLGNTILHLAVANKQTEIIEYLLSSAKIKVNEVNANGLTAMDILAGSRRDVKDLDIGDSLRQAGAFRVKDTPSGNQNETMRANSVSLGVHSQTTPLMNDSQQGGNLTEWLREKRNVILLVASLIATLTFQAAINPPGGVWQDDSPANFQGSPVPNPHKAGDAVMPYNHLSAYTAFYIANSMSFIMSLYTIIMLITGLVFRDNYISRILNAFMIVFMCMICISVIVIASVSIDAITPKKYDKEINRRSHKVMRILISCFLVIAVIAVLARILLGIFCRRRRRSSSDDVNYANGDQEAPLIPVDVDHATGDQEAPQIQVDVDHATGDQEAPQIPVDVDHVTGDQEAPQIPVDVDHATGDQEAPQIQVDVNHANGNHESPQIE